ncbi:hypothetical protein ROZALSC1DRAFT_29394 [Rozella allomycis CSF55]|uniref:Atos-like conserved domain-containing protein n=1 Tax=Rozella allomycis (strain CSF55) TaxID=988480 RepID=A0A075AP43_ROZAC|nr:hypothetical protein O9G_000198 [Rozella allomycis CSF55]RKP18954.1 hypothetical protein ROZALSC1DRAFT_29394 [Rozella allomycis CSF55]|eukprot:EPZ31719.1 hypothetical protein O9G_000198 [Rozella allomycis CSF55]
METAKRDLVLGLCEVISRCRNIKNSPINEIEYSSVIYLDIQNLKSIDEVCRFIAEYEDVIKALPLAKQDNWDLALNAYDPNVKNPIATKFDLHSELQTVKIVRDDYQVSIVYDVLRVIKLVISNQKRNVSVFNENVRSSSPVPSDVEKKKVSYILIRKQKLKSNYANGPFTRIVEKKLTISENSSEKCFFTTASDDDSDSDNEMDFASISEYKITSPLSSCPSHPWLNIPRNNRRNDLEKMKYPFESATRFVGSFEQSLISGRMAMSPSKPIMFTMQLSVHSQKISSYSRYTFEFPAYFYCHDDFISPYVGLVNLEKEIQMGPINGCYRIPPKGQLQIVIKSPTGGIIKVFLIPYDFKDINDFSKISLRQKTFTRINGSEYIRYAVHLNFIKGNKGRYFLHKNIRIIFSNRQTDESLHSSTTLSDIYPIKKPLVSTVEKYFFKRMAKFNENSDFEYVAFSKSSSKDRLISRCRSCPLLIGHTFKEDLSITEGYFLRRIVSTQDVMTYKANEELLMSEVGQ